MYTNLYDNKNCIEWKKYRTFLFVENIKLNIFLINLITERNTK